MLIFTKILAFILLLLWGVLTFTLVIPIALYTMDSFSNWMCGGKQLLQKVLQ